MLQHIEIKQSIDQVYLCSNLFWHTLDNVRFSSVVFNVILRAS